MDDELPGVRAQLLVAYGAVLNVHQLPEVRDSVSERVLPLYPGLEPDCRLVVQEMCLAVLADAGRCEGLRVYDRGVGVRVEVDAPAGRHRDARRLEQRIVASVAQRSGTAAEAAGDGERAGVDPRDDVSVAWCELDGQLTCDR